MSLYTIEFYQNKVCPQSCNVCEALTLSYSLNAELCPDYEHFNITHDISHIPWLRTNLHIDLLTWNMPINNWNIANTLYKDSSVRNIKFYENGMISIPIIPWGNSFGWCIYKEAHIPKGSTW